VADNDQRFVLSLGDRVGNVFDSFPFASFADQRDFDVIEFESVGFALDLPRRD
jgi:hypothetical protein